MTTTTPTNDGTTAGPTRPAPSGRVDPFRATLLVAEREIVTTARTRSFQISSAVMLLLVLGSILAISIFGGRTSTTTVAVVPGAEATLADGTPLAAAEDFELREVDETEARALVEQEEVSAALLPDPEAPSGVRVVALESAPGALMETLTVEPEVELITPPAADEGMRYLAAFGFGFVFLLSAAGFGSMIAQNTVQEKQSRIVEILVATVPPRSLMAGKIIGNSALAVAQTAAIAAVVVLGLVLTDQGEILSLVGAPVVWFVGFFLVGFVLLAGLFAAGAALVSRLEDVGSVTMPATMLIMAPYFLVIFFSDNDLVLRVMSYVPFSAPVAMPMRLFVGDADWWEPLVALAGLVLAAWLVIVLAAKIYERALLRLGGRAKLREVLAEE